MAEESFHIYIYTLQFGILPTQLCKVIKYYIQAIHPVLVGKIQAIISYDYDSK